jgi:sn-glycerol 3-phosphate transport system ATP-binding protein
MRLEIKRLQRRLGTTSVYVTHDQVEAMTMADRLIVMNAGNAEQIDSPMAVYERPASLFVAGFIGSPAMNFLPAEISGDGATAALAGGSHIRLPAGGLSSLAGRRVTLGVRPEHLRPVGDGEATFSMQVQLVETLGADTLAHGVLGQDAALLTLRLPGGAAVREGQSLGLAADPGELHFFDPESGQRIADL